MVDTTIIRQRVDDAFEHTDKAVNLLWTIYEPVPVGALGPEDRLRVERAIRYLRHAWHELLEIKAKEARRG